MNNMVVLVDKTGKEIGVCEKLEAHRRGLLHNGFSVFVFNSQHKLLLQRRALTKYHSAGLWSNTCCSHPQPGEPLQKTISHRLQHELGFDCPVQKIFAFFYHAKLEHGLSEYEYDQVFVGHYDGVVQPNASEVMEYRWENLHLVIDDVKQHPQQYTYWLYEILSNDDFVQRLKVHSSTHVQHIK